MKQGILSDKYLKGIPKNSRAAKADTFLSEDKLTAELLAKISKLNEIAAERGQTLSQMAVTWLLGVGGTTSVLVGASNSKQIKENVLAASNIRFSAEEIEKIDKILCQ